MSGGDRTSDLDPLLREGIDWVVRRQSGGFTPADQAAFVRWRALSPDHDAAYRRASELGALMRDVGKEMLGERAAQVVVPLRRPVLSRRLVLTGGLAASVAGMFAVGRSVDMLPGFGGRTPDFATTTGERRSIQLAQGLRLELDARTSIAFDRSVANRIELLEGRAEVQAELAPGAGVTLVAGLGEVSAYMARFEVRLDGGEACVTCLEGEVTVSRGAETVALGTRQQLVYTEESFGRPVMIDPAAVTAWKNGQLIFQQTPLSEVVREVNRYREGRVVIASSAVGQRPVNGIFFTSRIEDAIGQIQQITGARVTHLPGNIVVLS